jgi:large conductance mechanosensitive channel
MLSQFGEFLRKTDALALAVGVIIGAAIGKVVSSLVGDIIMPLVGLAVGGGDWRAWRIVLSTAPDGKVLSAVNLGVFVGTVVDFVIIAFCVFLIVKAVAREMPPAPGS